MPDFFRIHAVAADDSDQISLPPGDFDNSTFMCRALERLGLVPTGPLTALAASGQPLGRSGVKLDLGAVDRALKRTAYSVTQRIAFKSALGRHGLAQDGRR